MGTDIHMLAQARNNNTDKWEEVAFDYDGNRHYLLFSVLADVRNGYGFAGVSTYTPVEPISKPRGYPADIKVGDKDVINGRWMGYEYHSWLDTKEILEYFSTERKITRTGVITLEEYHKWDRVSQPEFWSGDVMGKDLVTLPMEDVDNGLPCTHVRIHWDSYINDECDYFIDAVRKLDREYEETRLVFGFDS